MSKPDPLMRASDVRRELGDISEVTMWRWERDNIIPPAIKINGRKYWRRSVVEAFKDCNQGPAGNDHEGE